MDPKLAKWLRWLPIIRREVEELVVARHVFNETQAIIAKNDEIRKPSSFYDFLARAYASHAVIGLRRQLKSDSQSISLTRLLEEMIASPAAFPRSYYTALYRGSTVEEFADRDFDRFASRGVPHIDKDLVAADLGRFVAACARCEEFADRRIAHRDRRDPRALPTYKEVDDCIGLADEIYVKYHLLFTASAMDSLLPTWQYDWQAIFRVPWLLDDGRSTSRNSRS